MGSPFHVVIPARYGSSRLPGKPLLEIAGKPMVQHVCEQAAESGAGQVVVATDDARIVDAVKAFGGEVMLTSAEHRSGTDRIAEVAERMGWAADAVVVNLQGDEPGMPPELVRQVAEDMFAHGDADMTTLATPILDKPHLFDPHLVKVVTDCNGYALYFSRAPIPWHRDEFAKDTGKVPEGVDFLRHIGLYAYRVGFLERFVTMPHAPIEEAESLEQLRVLWQGGRIHVSLASVEHGHGVDTLDDLNRVRERWERGV
jgi:3-deoxy-manno-octulosonate cytidylyltransferase (CMP-KDO synthetase)